MAIRSAVKGKPEPRSGERAHGFGAILVFERLRDEILSMELRPGQLIDESNLADRFEVSRSPVREALVRLAAEGLVVTVPNKGTVVAPLNLDEFPAYVDALDLIQRAVFRLAARHHSDADLVSIRAANEEFRTHVRANDALGMIRQNATLHLAMAAAGRNRILTDTYRRILDEGRRTLRLYFRSYGDTLPESLCDAHDAQIAAIAAGDEALAERLAHEHAEEVHQRFLRYMGERNSRDLTVDYGK
ncbi:GntR family transcriptional regulator [Devosia sp.]|uniref:GntR family transcriptional regulator n=1 Tax=Devosia sp. TaxID=1871048 RepID=UPI003BA930D0